MSKNSRFEGSKFGQPLSQNSGFEAIWTAGLSANSGFEGATEQKNVEVAYNVSEGEDLVPGKGAGSICKRVHGPSSVNSLGVSNSKFTGSFLFREYHVLILVQDCGFEAQMIVDLRPVLVTFCGQEMA